MYYNLKGDLIVLLVTLYKKSDKDDLDAGEKEQLRRLIDEYIGGL